MKANIDIKALAKEIANNNGSVKRAFEELVGKCDPDILDFYTITDGVTDGFNGYVDWTLDIRLTPSVKYSVRGGHGEWDHIVEVVDGIDNIAAYSVYFYDIEEEYELDQEQLEELEAELYKIL